MQVVDVNPVIFRGYDIRGLVDKELSEDVMYTLGRAYATYLSARRIGEASVGRDNRLTSDAYSKAFIQGLNEGGINTFDLGLSLSQIVYFSSYEFKTKGGAMISASHNPKEFNGLKLSTGYSETMVTEDILAFRALVDGKKFVEGHGTNTLVDIFPSYKKNLLKHFHLGKKWKVVIDASNTTSGKFYPEILREAGCEVIEQNCTLDGNFPLGVPDPTEVEVLKRLGEGVKTAGADLGFAYDPDGDRMAVVDEHGNTLWMDTIVALFAKDVLDFLPGSSIIYNTLCSRQVTDAIESAGGKPVMWITGHSFIKAKVKAESAPFGGELSGHIYFTENYYGHDDAAYASLRLLSYLERKNEMLSQAASQLSVYVSSPEIKFGLADDIKFKFIETVIAGDFKTHWPDAKYVTIDGVRADLPDRMAICRASQNGPYITVKFEGKTQAVYDEMKKTLKEILSSHPEIDWTKGVNTHALE
ncbi:MAG TPA: phosphomannomutase/phosphoglucomutase [Patescibacteria group bacterium]|nr:phosphomannomutase/phosphoglucomutase [Patescibacteria group bacterium]